MRPLPAVKQAIKQGNGLAVRIPHEIARKLNIKKGDLLIVHIEKVDNINPNAEGVTPNE